MNLPPQYNWGIPLIIQDKTFVPQNIATQDPAWPPLAATFPTGGQYGDLWMPHVYEPNQAINAGPNSPPTAGGIMAPGCLGFSPIRPV